MFSVVSRFGGGDPGVLKAMVAGGHLGMMVFGWVQVNSISLFSTQWSDKCPTLIFLASPPVLLFKASMFTLINFILPYNGKSPEHSFISRFFRGYSVCKTS